MCTVHTTKYSVYFVHCALRRTPCISVLCTLYSVGCTMYRTLHCTLCTPYTTMHYVQCTSTLHRTPYTVPQPLLLRGSSSVSSLYHSCDTSSLVSVAMAPRTEEADLVEAEDSIEEAEIGTAGAWAEGLSKGRGQIRDVT